MQVKETNKIQKTFNKKRGWGSHLFEYW